MINCLSTCSLVLIVLQGLPRFEISIEKKDSFLGTVPSWSEFHTGEFMVPIDTFHFSMLLDISIYLSFIPNGQCPGLCAFGFSSSPLVGTWQRWRLEKMIWFASPALALGGNISHQRSSWDRWPDLQLPPLNSVWSGFLVCLFQVSSPSVLSSFNIQASMLGSCRVLIHNVVIL